MILRIKKISQIGRFKNFKDGGRVTLGDFSGKNICAILGDNTYGKSTIADIFRSANDDAPLSIERRKTIPPSQNLLQAVELTYKESASTHEENIVYSASGWNNNLLKGKIMIFDQEFIHRNIFTGLDLTRENKENFTDFVVGEEGVALGEKIESRKREAQGFSKELKDIRPDFVKDETDDKKVEAFVNANVADSKESLEEVIENQKKSLERLNKTSEFANLPTVTADNETYLIQHSDFVNLILSIGNSSYDSVSKDAMMQIQEQIDKTDNSWLEKGTKFMTNGKCPYCTQETSAVEALISAYKAIYDEKYDTYVETINASISSSKATLNKLSGANLSDQIDKNVNIVKKYLPFLSELSDLSNKLDAGLVKLREAEAVIRERFLNTLQPKIDEFTSGKQLNIHKKYETTELTMMLDEAQIYISAADDTINTLYEILQECSGIINEKRGETAKWTPEIIEAKIKKVNETITYTERKIKRLAQDAQCKAYKTKQEEHKTFKAETVTLQNQLQSQQSNYLEGLFSSINVWFKKLGSNDFTLEQKQSTRGYKTVIELKVKFCNQLIDEKNLDKLFSESDRRSLALAIFFARAEQREKPDTILVLDDPIVSFDDNRIANTCNELKRLSSDFKQVIILTHYKLLIQQLLKTKANAVYAKLESQPESVGLASFETKDYLLSEHEKETA